jgi:hypothetical protein
LWLSHDSPRFPDACATPTNRNVAAVWVYRLEFRLFAHELGAT